MLFMLYGFYLLYNRDFASEREAWIAVADVSPHFEARLAHAHGNLFSIPNIVRGALLLWLPVRSRWAQLISTLAIIGLLMPVGILSEISLGLPSKLVLLGAVSITIPTAPVRFRTPWNELCLVSSMTVNIESNKELINRLLEDIWNEGQMEEAERSPCSQLHRP